MSTLASRLTRCPRPFAPERGAEAADALPAAPPELRALLEGAAGCSPYLAGLIARERAWLAAAVDDPEGALAQELSGLAAPSLAELPGALRQAKRRVALIAALADLGGAWSLEQVTGALSDLADAALQAGVAALVGAEIARGKLPGMDPEDAATGAGLVVMAMGKHGARELNYSSDIDLICLFDETRYDPREAQEARSVLVRVTRRLCGLMSDMTAEGYVFRTDLRLRPDASVTPVCLSMAAAEQYYESVGRSWERAAWIKARPVAGDLAAGARFVEALRPFVWRRHLDFAAIRETHDMRLKIRDHKGFGGPLTLEGHNVKLGRGGIREIEFYAQTRQLISGGRDASLRVRATVPALDRLAHAGWAPPETAQALGGHYRALREIEHRLQMAADAQTHDLPATPEGWERLAAMVDQPLPALREALTARLEAVHGLTESFFAPDRAAPAEAPDPAGDFGREITARWPSYPALRSARATEIFHRLRPEILSRLGSAARPEEALAQFDAFLSGLPAGVQLFSLFEANPQLTRLLVDICASAPALAVYLSQNPRVLDAVIGGSFFAPWPEAGALKADLKDRLDRAGDHEARLDVARIWMKELHFRVGVHLLQGLIDDDAAGRQYADIAETVVAALLPAVAQDVARRHGPAPGRGAMVLAMGSLGAGRLTPTSDLDLIVIYDAAGVETSDGPRPLPAARWYARLTQGLITALTALTAEGRLYEVDMRLRPSGKQGPVATSLGAFRAYQQQEAWVWEHLALTRARPVAGPRALRAAVEHVRREVLANGAAREVLAELSSMRRRLSEARPTQGPWDLRAGPGRLQDIELFGQSLALRAGDPSRGTRAQIAAGAAAGLLEPAQAEALDRAVRLMRPAQMALRLTGGPEAAPEDLGEGARCVLLQQAGMADLAALEAAIAEAAAAAGAAIEAALEEEGAGA
ncbi:glutamine-synthetase adenylyltransferase [Pseudoroseicyclus aestuarii]|uniref:Glutamate-ammonia-ligase adenylyltransferase n=1 Tax=Pseudoroseicyclus aestuarii TaxID=1795041 RepID=A0A318SVK9_9RHOB|nr:glutamine-synthetase adenylyltransferase [Pseudoroseicyclus aestuarii]PYE85643.1 glutamate-ammonia-ligase adenylyltransferase [Pseudoroseicyclus aestuarii]